MRELQCSQVLQARICSGWLFLCLRCCALVFVKLSRADHETIAGYCSGCHSVSCCPMVEQRRASSVPFSNWRAPRAKSGSTVLMAVSK